MSELCSWAAATRCDSTCSGPHPASARFWLTSATTRSIWAGWPPGSLGGSLGEVGGGSVGFSVEVGGWLVGGGAVEVGADVAGAVVCEEVAGRVAVCLVGPGG